ncbi:MAG: Holliday junction branch migration protein RuvA [Ginsengibacter sp.]
MIAYLAGKFTYKNPTVVYVDVNGIGYEVNISLNTYAKIQTLSEGKLFTHLQVKEDAHVLYGFFDAYEKEMFIMLISVSGIGAATARMMLSNMLPDEISRAIIQGNARQLESVKGIGKKTAERLVLELRDKVSKQPIDNSINAVKNNSLQQDALNALVALGISKSVAEQSVNKILSEEPSETHLEFIIKKALKAI